MTDLITRPAVRIQQGSKTLFATSFTVADFSRPDFYRVNRLDPKVGGFQRLLQETRAKRLKSYAMEAWKQGQQTFLPTSIFLATDKSIEFDSQRNMLSFNTNICPFDVVDGQHRIEGLLLAAKEEPELGQFPIITNIAVNTSPEEQMLHFYVVNTTQKAVDPGVGLHIRARFSRMLETHNLPYIPSWIKREIDTGKDEDAIQIINFLNTEEDSPLRGRIQGAHETRKKDSSVTEKSFSVILKKTIFNNPMHPLKVMFSENKRNTVFLHYWQAVARVFTNSDTQDNTVVYKSTGIEFFCRLSMAILSHAHFSRSYRVEDFEEIFRSLEEYVSPESQAILTPEWWKSGSVASGYNSGAISKMAVEFSQYVNALSVDTHGETS